MSTPEDRNKLRCAMDYLIEAEKNGEITPENVIYIVENINVAGIIHLYFLLNRCTILFFK